MAPTAFVNTNRHKVYVDDPEVSQETTVNGIFRFAPDSEVTASGPLAELLESAPGVVKASSDEGKAYTGKTATAQRALTNGEFGPDAFPVPEDERSAERSGLHITGQDSGIPVASPDEPGDTKDGTGADPFVGVAAVRQGEVERGDVPAALADEPYSDTTDDFNKVSAKNLRKRVTDLGLEIDNGRDKRGKKKAATKPQMVAALEAHAAGSAATQTEDASKSETSEAKGAAANTGTLTSDKVTTPRGRSPRKSTPKVKKAKRRSASKRSSKKES